MSNSNMRNPGLQPGVSRDLLSAGWSPFVPTSSNLQAQMLAGRFCVCPLVARDLAELCFGEAQND